MSSITPREARDTLGGLLLALLLISGLIWSTFEADDLKARSAAHLADQAGIHAGLERTREHLDTTRAIASQEAEKAAGHYRKLREMAEGIRPNPFQTGR